MSVSVHLSSEFLNSMHQKFGISNLLDKDVGKYPTQNILYVKKKPIKINMAINKIVDLPGSILCKYSDEEIQRYNINISNLPDKHPQMVCLNKGNKFSLRAYQEDMVNEYFNIYNQLSSRVINGTKVLPFHTSIKAKCGLGKTAISLIIAKTLGFKICVVLKLKSLMSQWSDTCKDVNVRCFLSCKGITAFKDAFHIKHEVNDFPGSRMNKTPPSFEFVSSDMRPESVPKLKQCNITTLYTKLKTFNKAIIKQYISGDFLKIPSNVFVSLEKLLARCKHAVGANQRDEVWDKMCAVLLMLSRTLHNEPLDERSRKVYDRFFDIDRALRKYDVLMIPDKHLSSDEICSFIHNKCTTMIVDEAHEYHLFHDSYINKFLTYNNIHHLICLSATPRVCNEIHVPYSITIPKAVIDQIIKEQNLSRVVYSIYPSIRVTKYDIPEYNRLYLALHTLEDTQCDGYLEMDQNRTDYIINHIVHVFNNNDQFRGCVVTSRRKPMLYIYDKLSKLLNTEEERVVHILDAKSSTIQQQLVAIRKTSGKYLIISTQQYIGTGLDIATLNTLHIHCFEYNSTQIEQVAGRIERNNPSKNRAIYIYPFISIHHNKKSENLCNKTTKLMQDVLDIWDYQPVAHGMFDTFAC